MSERLGASFLQMKQFSADVSHELRTPITAIRGQLEVALFTAKTTDQYREAMFNALQPGVFALSGWDLSGMLTVDAVDVADLIADGDTRWINRGAHDLRGVDEPAREGRMPAARSLYGTLPEQR